MAGEVGQPVAGFTRDLLGLGAGVRCRQSCLGPEPSPYGGERVAEGGLVLPAPGGRSSDEPVRAVHVICLKRDEPIAAGERRRRAGDSPVRPLALRLDAEVATGFGESHLDAPGPHEPRQDIRGLHGEAGAQERLRLEPPEGRADPGRQPAAPSSPSAAAAQEGRR